MRAIAVGAVDQTSGLSLLPAALDLLTAFMISSITEFSNVC